MTEPDKHDDPQDSSHDALPEAPEDGSPRQAESADEPIAKDHRARTGRRGRTGPLVWLALLLALGSIGLASYPFWSDWINAPPTEQVGPSVDDFERLAARVNQIQQERETAADALRDDLDRLSSELQASMETPGPSADDLAGRIDQLSMRVERMQGERNTALGGVRSRLEELESEVGRRFEQFELKLSNVGSNIDQADRDLAARLLMMEVDSLFAIAQNRLAISGDAGAALQAWERAMERLTALDGAEFQSLKDTAQREFRRLQEYAPPDLGSRVETLFDTADAVAQWPVKTVQPEQQPTQSGESEGWRGRLSRVFGNLVRVESVDQEFLDPVEVDLARERVRTTLQTAALALARSHPELAGRLIEKATDAAQRVFDTDAANVSEALNRLAEIAGGTGRAEPPALTESRAEISRLLGDIR